MREILFRGFHPCENGTESVWIEGKEIKGRWVYGWFVGGCNKTPFSPFEESAQIIDKDGWWHEVAPETVGQYTGLMDKNGTRIFEGDIVKKINYMGDEFTEIIVYYNEQCMFSFGYMILYFPFEDESYEVLGNIHSNPELLEAKS